MCLSCNLCSALLSLSPCSDLGKCGCCTQNPSLGNHFIHTAKGPWRSEKALTEQSQAFSGMHSRSRESKWNAQSCPYVPSFSYSLPAGTGVPAEQGKGWTSPAAHPTCWAGVQAGCGLVHMEAPSLQNRWPAWPVDTGTPAHVKASGSSEHSVGFSWCHCTFWKLPSTLASLSFPLADFIAKCAFACVSGGLWGVGCSGRNSCLQGLVLCNYVQLEFSVDRDRFTSYK